MVGTWGDAQNYNLPPQQKPSVPPYPRVSRAFGGIPFISARFKAAANQRLQGSCADPIPVAAVTSLPKHQRLRATAWPYTQDVGN